MTYDNFFVSVYSTVLSAWPWALCIPPSTISSLVIISTMRSFSLRTTVWVHSQHLLPRFPLPCGRIITYAARGEGYHSSCVRHAYTVWGVIKLRTPIWRTHVLQNSGQEIIFSSQPAWDISQIFQHCVEESTILWHMTYRRGIKRGAYVVRTDGRGYKIPKYLRT